MFIANLTMNIGNGDGQKKFLDQDWSILADNELLGELRSNIPNWSISSKQREDIWMGISWTKSHGLSLDILNWSISTYLRMNGSFVRVVCFVFASGHQVCVGAGQSGERGQSSGWKTKSEEIYHHFYFDN